jgi:predicted RNA binding protein YcfA (HicA-like mRNA interferase family)
VPRRPKVRTLLRDLRALGCQPERAVGSHQIWRTPAGSHVTVVVNHPNADVSSTVLASVRRVLRREGLLRESAHDPEAA